MSTCVATVFFTHFVCDNTAILSFNIPAQDGMLCDFLHNISEFACEAS